MASVGPGDLRIGGGNISHPPCGRLGVRGECATCWGKSLLQVGPSFPASPAQLEREKRWESRTPGLGQHRFHACSVKWNQFAHFVCIAWHPIASSCSRSCSCSGLQAVLEWQTFQIPSPCTWHSIFPWSHSRLMNAMANSAPLLITISVEDQSKLSAGRRILKMLQLRWKPNLMGLDHLHLTNRLTLRIQVNRFP